MSPKGGVGLTLLTAMFSFVASMLDQADVKTPILVYVFAILAMVSFVGHLALSLGLGVRLASAKP